MDTYRAYEALGLTPLDEHLKNTTGDRRLGATTWMLVEAALAVLRGEEVVVVGKDITHATALAEQCQEYIRKLGFPVYKGGKRHIATVSGHLFWESHGTIVRFRQAHPDVKEYRDHLWRQHAVNRRAGPYKCIWRLDQKPGTSEYDAYDHRGEFLMTLPEESMREVVRERPEVEFNSWNHP